MKFIAATIFLMLLLMQTFSKWLLVIEYVVNKEYIAKNLCQNQNKPQLSCHGKCQLLKEMASEQSGSGTSSSGNSTAKMFFSDVWFDNNTSPARPEFIVSDSKNFNSCYLIKKYSASHSRIFRPPWAPIAA